MTRAAFAAVTVLFLAGCTAGPASSSESPSPSPSPDAGSTPVVTMASPGFAATPSAPPTVAPGAPPTTAPGSVFGSVYKCWGPIPASGNLVLAQLTGSASTVLRDITNISSPNTLCAFSNPIAPRFVTASSVAFPSAGNRSSDPGSILRLDLATGIQGSMASWQAGGFGAGAYDPSPDGRSLTYIAPSGSGLAWHLVSGAVDRILTTLPPVPGRGVSQENDDFNLTFSPDGNYISLVETFTGSGSGDTAPFQIRRASDGGLVFSTGSGTMAVWASVPSRLFFRSESGALSRWDPSSGPGALQPSLKWVRPHASADGRWIAYTSFDSAGHPHANLYSVQGNSVQALAGDQLRSGAQFLNGTLVWYSEEVACDCGITTWQPTGKAFIYDIASATESPSRITGVYDVWPRVTSPPGFGY